MPVFYLRDNLTIKKELYRRGTINPLYKLSEESKTILIGAGKIIEIQTPPVSVFEPLAIHAKLLGRLQIETLGDFAFYDFAQHHFRLKGWGQQREELGKLQAKVRELIHPKNSLKKAQEEDCGCGESPRVIPVADE